MMAESVCNFRRTICECDNMINVYRRMRAACWFPTRLDEVSSTAGRTDTNEYKEGRSHGIVWWWVVRLSLIHWNYSVLHSRRYTTGLEKLNPCVCSFHICSACIPWKTWHFSSAVTQDDKNIGLIFLFILLIYIVHVQNHYTSMAKCLTKNRAS